MRHRQRRIAGDEARDEEDCRQEPDQKPDPRVGREGLETDFVVLGEPGMRERQPQDWGR